MQLHGENAPHSLPPKRATGADIYADRRGLTSATATGFLTAVLMTWDEVTCTSGGAIGATP